MMVKIDRTFPAPPSLAIEAKKASGKYDKSGVVEQLRRDAHDKCYICEMKGLQDPVVERLLKDGKRIKQGTRKTDKYANLWYKEVQHCIVQ